MVECMIARSKTSKTRREMSKRVKKGASTLQTEDNIDLVVHPYVEYHSFWLLRVFFHHEYPCRQENKAQSGRRSKIHRGMERKVDGTGRGITKAGMDRVP